MLFSTDHVLFFKVVVIVNVFMYWQWHSSRSCLEDRRWNVQIWVCLFFFVKCIDELMTSVLRLEVKLFLIVSELQARHRCDTFSSGTVVRKRMIHLSHNAEKNKVMQLGLRWQCPGSISKIRSSRGFTAKTHHRVTKLVFVPGNVVCNCI